MCKFKRSILNDVSVGDGWSEKKKSSTRNIHWKTFVDTPHDEEKIEGDIVDKELSSN